MATIIDSYSESNVDGSQPLHNSGLYSGQSFSCSVNATLDSMKFWLSKQGSPTGNIYAYLYSLTGTPGSTAVPSTLLATSDPIDVSALGAGELVTFTFSGAERVDLSTGDYYAVCGGNSSASPNLTRMGVDSSSPSHSGNFAYYDTSWHAYSSWDAPFYVYGEVAAATGGNMMLLGIG